MFSERIPLRKLKTMRNTLSGKKNAEQFPQGTCLQTVSDFFSWVKYNYSCLVEHGCECFGGMLLHSAPWCSNLAWGSSGDTTWNVGVGFLPEAETLGQRSPTPLWERRRHYHPQLLSWWLGPEITRWQVSIHFCVKDVSLVWGRVFPLSRR